MATVVDSNQKPLSGPEILLMAANDQAGGETNTQVIAAALATELNYPGTDVAQVGNTVFLGHRGKGKAKGDMVGRAVNVDTAQNFVANGLKYLTYLQKKGIKRYQADFENPQYVSAFKYWHSKVQGTDTKILVRQSSAGWYRAYIRFGKQPLNKFWDR